MLECVFTGGGERAGDQFVARRADVEAAGDVHELDAGEGFELVPEFIGAAEEGDIMGVLIVGEADEAGLAVGGAQGVGDVELVKGEDFFATALGREAALEMGGGGGAHGAGAEDDGVIIGCHGAIVRQGAGGWQREIVRDANFSCRAAYR